MTLPATAVEFAADRGHPEYPLLSADDSPNSRVPCMDFSPWLKHRLEVGDETAALAYVLQIVEANPGVGFGLEIEYDEAGAISMIRRGELPASSPHWAEHWIETTRKVLASPLDSLVGLGVAAEHELRTALVMLTPLGSLDEFALVSPSDKGAAVYLAAAMSPYEIRLSEPNVVADRSNKHIRRMQGPSGAPAWADIPPVTQGELTPPPPDPGKARRMARLPLGSRAHLADLGRKMKLRGPGVASTFRPFYETRRRGYDVVTGLEALGEHGLVELVSAPEIVRPVVAMARLTPELHKLLDDARVAYPKSAPKKRLVELLEAQAPDQIDRLLETERVYQLTDEGRAAADWTSTRVTATSRMWAAWLAAHLSEPRE